MNMSLYSLLIWLIQEVEMGSAGINGLSLGLKNETTHYIYLKVQVTYVLSKSSEFSQLFL